MRKLTRSALFVLVAAMVLAGCGRRAQEFDTWARDICAQNDAIDQDAAAQLPRTQVVRDMHYREKVDALIERKQRLKNAVDEYTPPMSRSALRNQLGIALNNSIRYLRALRDQYDIAVREYERMEDSSAATGVAAEVDTLIRDIASDQAAYRVDPRELLMKQQYEKLYNEVRAKLGLEQVNVPL